MSDVDEGKPVKLSIVFLNFNRLEETRETVYHLHSLIAQRDDIEVIAVDNASIDGTHTYLRKSGWLQVISMPRNTGIAGYNEGFKLAKGEYILVLDDDSHPKDINTLNRLIQRLDESPEIGIVACGIESADGKPVYTWHLPSDRSHGESTAFIGCGFVIRRDLFERVGWYPGEFFLYQNEIEVAIRVKKLGFKIYYDPECQVIHREAPTRRPNWRRVYYPTRNTIWVIRRYFPFPMAAYLIATRLCIGFIRAIQCREFRWYYRAIKEGFRTPVKTEILPKSLRRELEAFWKNNSLWHQLTSRT